MKGLLLILLIATKALGADGVAHSPAVYRDCVQWTIYNGVPTSKGFEFVVDADNTFNLTVSFYDGTQNCDNASANKTIYKSFQVQSDNGIPGFRHVQAKELISNLYFDIMVSDSLAMITFSNQTPVVDNMTNTIDLKRVQ